MRRLSAPAFRGENLRIAGPALLEEMDNLIARLRCDCAGGAYVDVLQLFPKLTLDVCGSRSPTNTPDLMSFLH